MTDKEKKIYKSFDGKLIGSHFMRNMVIRTLSKMSGEIVDTITKNCWFVSSMDDAWAFTFTGNDLKNKHLIFLSEDLLSQGLKQIRYSIAHEIGHVILGHRNSIAEIQTRDEIRKQEKEADEFARSFGFAV